MYRTLLLLRVCTLNIICDAKTVVKNSRRAEAVFRFVWISWEFRLPLENRRDSTFFLCLYLDWVRFHALNCARTGHGLIRHSSIIRFTIGTNYDDGCRSGREVIRSGEMSWFWPSNCHCWYGRFYRCHVLLAAICRVSHTVCALVHVVRIV